ncbi:MAG: 3-hydroxyanthranilate 3,4-dioxygenase [Saprospiraceae bacterium]
MNLRPPFNIFQWIKDHRSELKPPVGNKNLYTESEDYVVMIVAGPNSRKDYHYNETEEWYFQLEGDIVVKVQQEGKSVEIPIKEGEMFLLPPKVPHSPSRPENTIGLVIECKRKKGETDGLMWFCENCNSKLHESYFPLENIEKDFLPRFKQYYETEELRTCKQCGHVMAQDPRFIN